MVYAIATSDNIYAVKTHLFLGCDKLANRLKDFYFTGEIPSIPSLALGVKEVSVKELTEAYAILANNGTRIEPTYITKIITMNDELLYESKHKETYIASNIDTYILSESMTSIFDNNMTYNIRPTGVVVKSMLTGKYAGKSGSTDTDNWMIGYNPDIVVGVWTGYDNNSLISTTDEARFGKYIWADVINSYYKIYNKTPSWYNTPSDVIGIELNPNTGFYGDINDYTKTLYFNKYNLPWFISMKKDELNVFSSSLFFINILKNY